MFRYFVINWDVSPLFECFVVFICICLPFTQSQCSNSITLKIRDLKGTLSSFVQAYHLLNIIPQIISKAIFRTSPMFLIRLILQTKSESKRPTFSRCKDNIKTQNSCRNFDTLCVLFDGFANSTHNTHYQSVRQVRASFILRIASTI